MRSPLSLLSAALLLSPALQALVSGDYVDNSTECDNTGNPWLDHVSYVNSGFAHKLDETVTSFLSAYDADNAGRTKTVQKASTFLWVTAFDAISYFASNLEEAKAAQQASYQKIIVPFVIYNIPNRDCASKASAGEISLTYGALDKYKQFIDQIVTLVKQYDQLDFAIILEPDSLGNLVTNLDTPKCYDAQDVYIQGIGYAISALQMSNVALYIDAAHSNWLGWPANLEPAAKIFKKALDVAGPTAKIRGFSTNVANYQPYDTEIKDPIYGNNTNWSELRYIKALTPYLLAQGLPAKFIVDQGRSGVQNIRHDSNRWCNIKGAGYGTRPTTDTGDCAVDSIVWVKPGGDSDGTSDTNSTRFDTNCISPDAYVPAPEAGGWMNGYAMDLVRNANPPLEISH